MRNPTGNGAAAPRRVLTLLIGLAALGALAAPETLAKKGGGGPGGSSGGSPAIACVKEKHANFGKIQGTSYVVIMDMDGANETVVLQRSVDNVTPVQFLHPSWSPTGKQLAYTTTSGGLYTVDADGRNDVCLRTGAELVWGPGGHPPAWSPDGARLAYSSGGDVWLIDADGTDETNLTGSAGDSEALPTWAPDGRLAYVLWRGPEPYGDADILVHDGDTTTNVTEDGPLSGARISRVSWAKTQDLLAVCAAAPTGGQPPYGNPDIWVVDLADPLNPVNLTDTPDVAETHPSWSSDDARVVFASDGDLYTMEADGADVTRVAAGDPGGKYGVWYGMPDGRR